jgi:hypothetical protein
MESFSGWCRPLRSWWTLRKNRGGRWTIKDFQLARREEAEPRTENEVNLSKYSNIDKKNYGNIESCLDMNII